MTDNDDPFLAELAVTNKRKAVSNERVGELVRKYILDGLLSDKDQAKYDRLSPGVPISVRVDALKMYFNQHVAKPETPPTSQLASVPPMPQPASTALPNVEHWHKPAPPVLSALPVDDRPDREELGRRATAREEFRRYLRRLSFRRDNGGGSNGGGSNDSGTGWMSQ